MSSDCSNFERHIVMIEMTVGPSTAMKRTGRMKSMSGKRMLTGIFIAFSYARMRRFSRISFACVRSTPLTETPYTSACTIARTKLRRSGTDVRSSSAR